MKLLSKDDSVIFEVGDVSLEYTVCPTFLAIRYSSGTEYLKNNDSIFRLLKLNKEEFTSKAYGYPSGNGDWPVYREDDYEAATRVVEALLEICSKQNTPVKKPESKYKVGDEVIIAKRKGSELDYPHHFSDFMADLAGRKFIIKDVKPVNESTYRGLRYYEEPFKYYLEHSVYTWSSAMLEPVKCKESSDDCQDCLKKDSDLLSETLADKIIKKKIFKINILECEITLQLKTTNKYRF